MVQEKVSTIAFGFHKHGAWKRRRAGSLFHYLDWGNWLKRV